jgi:hypothetical protein
VRGLSIPNGIDLGEIVLTQWREQQGVFLQPLDIGKTLTLSAKSKERCILAKN